jgi:hypothetical protein
LLALGAVGAVVFPGLAIVRVGPPPEISIEAALPGIGKRTPITVRFREPKRGLAGIRVELVQGQRVKLLGERRHQPRPSWKLWGPRQAEDRLELAVGRDTVQGLEEGRATIQATAERAGTLLRHPRPVSEELVLPVKLRPPSLQPTSTRTYVAQGGCEAVVYRVGESSARDGVLAGDWFFPGHPLPGGGARDRFALFAVPYDLADPARVRLVAADDVGNQAQIPFIDQFTPRPLRRDTVVVTEEFLSRVVPAILSQTPELRDRGSPLDNYLQINGDLRRSNAKTLVELARNSAPKFLWTRTFLQQPNSQVTSSFADRRSYLYRDRHVDTQDHLGFDLASVRHAEVAASNRGVVVLARYLGIYGNVVVIDHGYGLQSLYGHLSSFAVEEGQTVERGQAIGRTGDTGLAGGDHLHFTVMLHGLPVNPAEWWDPNWIDDRIKLKLGPAFRFEG